MLDSDLNYRYWDRMSKRYYKREIRIKIFLALTTSSVVAGWGFWKDIDIIWQGLSAFSALLAIALPIIDLPKTIENMTELRSNWHNMYFKYENLWIKVNSNASSSDEIQKEYDLLRSKEATIDEPSAHLPHDKNLILICYKEVLRNRDIDN